MRSVLYGPLSEDVDRLLTRRRELGLDNQDEVWNGEYHMSPSHNLNNARVRMRTAMIIGHLIERAGFFPVMEFNLGHRDGYRVPDFGAVRTESDDVWADEAVIVGEILSPGDETFEKLDHYWAHGVEELFGIDPGDISVRILVRNADGSFDDSDRSEILDISAADLAGQLDR